MIDGQHGSRHEPGEAEDGANYDQHGNDQKVQVVAAAFLEYKRKRLSCFRNYFEFSEKKERIEYVKR